MKKVKPKKGQESVWDYPRPPAIEQVTTPLRIYLNGEVIANTNHAYRVLETSHPPTYYLPISDFIKGSLIRKEQTSTCEFKGTACYYDVKQGRNLVAHAAWGYPDPKEEFKALKGHVAVYAHKMEECYVGDEKVQAQEGDFYGGWITSKIVGPFKGSKGTWGW